MNITGKLDFIKILSGLFLLVLFGCAPQTMQLTPERAKLGYETAIHKDLISLPRPAEPVVVAVYNFRDKTGQYKSSQAGMTWSTAVTQGATSLLVRALEESGWFVPLEREGLSNLLNERRIIRQTRQQYSGQNGQRLNALPPLMYAGITLEGGIISYETNRVTGGFGAKYFGLGGSTQFRQDQVTIYLRAVSTKNGRVLKTVHTTKSILSRLVDTGLYRYVRVKRLLELESGYSRNEPVNMCVREAIEKAVYSLIIEGVNEGLWSLADTSKMDSPLFEEYYEAKEQRTEYAQFDQWGNLITRETYRTTAGTAPENLAIGFHSTGLYYQGDYQNPRMKPGGEINLRFGINHWFSVMLSAGGGQVADKNNFSSILAKGELTGMFTLFPKKSITPVFYFGPGVNNYWVEDQDGETISRNRSDYCGWRSSLVTGGGIEYFLIPNMSIQAGIKNNYIFNDELDGIVHGDKDDSYWSITFGAMLYFDLW